ncbi:MAG: maleate isomerase [Gammaproteobacteria bacterium]|jgi:maleate isomerase
MIGRTLVARNTALSAEIGPRTLLGVLTPSSNTVLEPITAAMLAPLGNVSAHFARFRVKEIALDEGALGQFDASPILAAAQLLADAKVGSIIWSGTSSGWLGFETDEALCQQITATTGVAAGSSVLALNETFTRTAVQRFALVTPYLQSVQEKIIANYARAGFECVAERHLDDRDNFSFSRHSEATIADMIRDVAKTKPDAITVFCTNMRGAGVVAQLEQEIGIPIYDTVATGVWCSMQLAGDDPSRIQGWGRLFDDGRA